MALRVRNQLEEGKQEVLKPSEYSQLLQNEKHPAFDIDDNTSYIPRSITYEDIDRAVFNELDQKFVINGKPVKIILLDAPYQNQINQAPHLTDNVPKHANTFLSYPYITFWRNGSIKKYRVSPSNRGVAYSIPKYKKDKGGLVYEQYTMLPPRREILSYEIKFYSMFRGHINQIQEQVLEYFKNKYNTVTCDGERFTIYPNDMESPVSIDASQRGDSPLQSAYVLTLDVKVDCYLRDASQVQVREVPARLALSFSKYNKEAGNNFNIAVDEFTPEGHNKLDHDVI